MAKKDKNSSDTSGADSGSSEKLEKIKNRLLTTGIEDYGFWWTQMLKEQSNKSASDQSFRRGRIWS